MFDGRKVRKLWNGSELEPLTTASRELLNATRASRVRGIRAQAVVFYGWAVEGPAAPLVTDLQLSDSERDYISGALSTAKDLRCVVVKPFVEPVAFDPCPSPTAAVPAWMCVRRRTEGAGDVWVVSET